MHHSSSVSTCSEADLDIEAQRTTNVSHGQQNGTYSSLKLVKEIIPKYPRLLLEQNSSGQTPLHLAAQAHGGHTCVVEVFVETITFASARLCTEESQRLRLNPYILKDKDGNTALYYAIEGRYKEMATCLVNANQDAPFLGNNEGISSLYEAVSAGNGYKSIVKAILKTIGNKDVEVRRSNLDSKLQGNKLLEFAELDLRECDRE